MHLHAKEFINMKQFIIAFIFSLFISTALSAEKSEIIKLAKYQYQLMYDGYKSQVGYCLGQASTNKITNKNKKILQSLNITQKQLKKALLALSMKTNNYCAEKNLGLLLIARGKYINTLNYYKINDNDNDINTDIDLFSTPEIFYGNQLDYLKLPYEVREKIESIRQLDKPFSKSFIRW